MKYALSVVDDDELIRGVVVAGRPVARNEADLTLEVTRLCTDGTKNACSMLYAAAWRVAKAMGYERMITFILDEEPGTSLKAAGWKLIGLTSGGTWDRPNRGRTDKHPLQPKQKWEVK